MQCLFCALLFMVIVTQYKLVQRLLYNKWAAGSVRSPLPAKKYFEEHVHVSVIRKMVFIVHKEVWSPCNLFRPQALQSCWRNCLWSTAICVMTRRLLSRICFSTRVYFNYIICFHVILQRAESLRITFREEPCTMDFVIRVHIRDVAICLDCLLM